MTLTMQILTTGDTAQHYAWYGSVPGHSESFFESDDGEEEQVGEEMCAEDNGGEIRWEEAEEDVGERMVIVCCERVRGSDGVEVSFVEFADISRGVGVEDKAVDIIL
tara:strand:+ start:319 stop:639 length:321 start_codon:yes stop_codon:yes gene_type:complete